MWRAALAALAVLAGPAVLSAAPAAAAPTIVSLEFDDGVADQQAAVDILAAHGMHGTFFVNSGRPGRNRFLSLEQLHAMERAGNEIGGHTIDHVDLPTLGPDDQAREICNDRATLLNLGFRVTDLAYPFGDHDAGVEQTAQGCGYNSARTTSGVKSPDACVSGCPPAESIPPRGAYVTRAPTSVHADTPLSTLTGYVEQAKAGGGGWIQIVMHHVCDGCNPNAISPGLLSQFLDYLAAQAGDGVQVQTVAEVIGGPVNPPVYGPPLALEGAPSNLLHNPGLETPGRHPEDQPACWERGGAGTSTATWTHTADAHGGMAAEQVQITAIGAKSDRKLVTRQDTGICAPVATAGQIFRMTFWYHADAAVRPVAYLRDAVGHWYFWAQGAPVSPSGAWRQELWTLPPIPAGTSEISVGISLRSLGVMALDDLLLQDVSTPLPPPPLINDDLIGDAPRTPPRVARGRVPILVYPRVGGLLAAQRGLQRHLALLRGAGFTPIGAGKLARVLAGKRIRERKPVAIVFSAAPFSAVTAADGQLAESGVRALLLPDATGPWASASAVRKIARPARWNVVTRASKLGAVLRGRRTARPHGQRFRVGFATTDRALLRDLRAAARPR